MNNVATHRQPAWGPKSNTILRINLAADAMPGRFEQIWAKKVGDDCFEVCCIPFFAYGIALGDLVEADANFTIIQVKEKCGRRLLRFAIADERQWEAIHVALHDWVEKRELLYEWLGARYLAVDIPPRVEIPDLSSFDHWQKEGSLVTEVDV